jgi:signal peptidase I
MSEPGGVLLTNSTAVLPKPAADDGTNIKETIESILVAFILAFIFRAFVVEAFVIPTGSMAPTLLGAHMRFRCPDCGWTFDVNYSSRSETEDEEMRTPPDAYPVTDIYCPNCGYHIASPQGQSVAPVPVNFGDRILVLKYLYLMHPPRRWDVVVFKSPDLPQEFHYQQNFIKRLVGLPGEKLMVLDGDIYTWDPSENQWAITKKPRSAQEALWRLVYDNDFHPQLSHRPAPPQWVQPWRADGTGWDEDAANGRIFKFDNAGGIGTLRFDPNANSTTQTLSDFLVYDAGAQMRRPGSIGSPDDANSNPVSDLKLAANYTRTSGAGAFQMRLSRFDDVDHTFTAEITPDAVRLTHRTSMGAITTLRKPLSELGIRGDRPIFVELVNVDYRVTLRLNGHDVFEPMDYEPNVRWLMEQWRAHRPGGRRPGEAEIEAQNQTCTIEHLSLWRDVYYTNRSTRGEDLNTATPGNPVQLGPREYFTMGDNSAISKDARYWAEPIDLPYEGLEMPAGRVPEQFLLGKAVFVYWPAGFRAYDHLSIIPNFGDMRWIH